ncbi:hypothetical protein PoB_007537600 [Plakobranchus ocellatus]|uniref:Uncharacterized protein n=1 Tax=Plakobranchus ocellatus TaxID=259542 RepID=A0AAV4DYF5_9GAST|nr:hypothetical protein PoB_007537600 [Plakobranchus ocellatus]
MKTGKPCLGLVSGSLCPCDGQKEVAVVNSRRAGSGREAAHLGEIKVSLLFCKETEAKTKRRRTEEVCFVLLKTHDSLEIWTDSGFEYVLLKTHDSLEILADSGFEYVLLKTHDSLKILADSGFEYVLLKTHDSLEILADSGFEYVLLKTHDSLEIWTDSGFEYVLLKTHDSPGILSDSRFDYVLLHIHNFPEILAENKGRKILNRTTAIHRSPLPCRFVARRRLAESPYTNQQ